MKPVQNWLLGRMQYPVYLIDKYLHHPTTVKCKKNWKEGRCAVSKARKDWIFPSEWNRRRKP